MAKYRTEQWKIIVLHGPTCVCNAICLSVQAPFYPQEAEEKGSHASEYGMVFSIYFLIMFLTSLMFGKFLPVIGTRHLSLLGLFVTGTTSLLFASLHLIQEGKTFIAFSFIIRSVEAAGTSAYLVSINSIIIQEFPDDLGFTFGILEAMFSVGFIIGPTIGAVLYEIGGFALPFIATGVMLLSVMLLILVFLPSSEENSISSHSTINTLTLLRMFPVMVGLFAVFVVFFNMDFLSTVLEPHLRQLNPTHLQTGLVFMVFSLLHSISSVICGFICDKTSSPHYVWLFGAIASCLALVFLGPAPYLHFQLNLPLSFIFIGLQGIGSGSQVVSSFTALTKYIIEAELPEGNTYALISILFTSFVNIGSFFGSFIAGFLFENVGFSWGVHIIISLQLLLILLTCICFMRKSKYFVFF